MFQKNFDVLAISLNVLHNFLAKKIFLDLYLDTLFSTLVISEKI